MRNGSTCMRPLVRRPRALQQRDLVARTRRPTEGSRVERREPSVEAELARGDLEQRCDLVRVLALPALAVEEARVADASAARVADAGQHALAALRVVRREPCVEEPV